ncbi:hypothetical protein [Mycoplasma capricolum]|uniref:hypothetical protein n=1 Tax=Mycoplasma capricolum TaxID=2095 RepID=UPI003DA67D12
MNLLKPNLMAFNAAEYIKNILKEFKEPIIAVQILGCLAIGTYIIYLLATLGQKNDVHQRKWTWTKILLSILGGIVLGSAYSIVLTIANGASENKITITSAINFLPPLIINLR